MFLITKRYFCSKCYSILFKLKKAKKENRKLRQFLIDIISTNNAPIEKIISPLEKSH